MSVMLTTFYLNVTMGQWSYSGVNIYNTNSGYVGIGNSSPGSLLDVAKNMGEPAITIHNLGGGGGATYSMIDDLSGANWKFKATTYGGFKIRDNANSLDVITIEANSAANALYVKSGGNVGIHTTTPAAKLEVFYNANNYCQVGLNTDQMSYFFHSELETEEDGQAAISAWRTDLDPLEDPSMGTGYGLGETNQAIQGYSEWGDYYSFGVAGFNFNDAGPCGGILGASSAGDYWGSLGYKATGGSAYGGYFTSYSTVTGKGDRGVHIGIGMGSWGDLIGAEIHGKIYGTYTEGKNYALFSHGIVYRDNLDVHLQEDRTGENTVMYTNVSTDATIQTCGTAILSVGKATISFDPGFASVVSSKEPLVVTVTPVGESNGVYLSGVTSAGFTVMENNAGKSNITVNYIAIGKRAGYENPQLAIEVTQKGYTDKLARGLHNEADTRTKGEGLYYDSGTLTVGRHPSTMPDRNNEQPKNY